MKFGIDIARAFRENETKVKKRYEKKIERLEMDNALVRGGNEEKRNQIKSLESTLATYKAVVEKMREALKHKTYRGDGIYRIQVEWIDAVDRALQAAEEEE